MNEGLVYIHKTFLGQSSENTLKSIFSEFYPINIFESSFNTAKIYHGKSNHFDPVKIGVPFEYYTLDLELQTNGDFLFKGFKKITNFEDYEKFNRAVNEYILTQTINGTKPLLIWTGNDYLVSWFFSQSMAVRKLGEVVL